MDGQFGKVRDYLTAALCCAAAVLLDQVTKHLAVAHLKLQREIVLIPGVFELRYLENRGAAFAVPEPADVFCMRRSCHISSDRLFLWKDPRRPQVSTHADLRGSDLRGRCR